MNQKLISRSRLIAIGCFSIAMSNWGIADQPPNVLMILVDDLKPAIGCYGDEHAKTPHIDRLASRGIRFDRAYCNQAVCAPSRFTLMLGSHSTSTGLYGLGSQLRQVIPNAVTIPQFFKHHGGYRTESLGKVFHIGHGNHGDPESFEVPHFKEKVIEYLNPESTEGGKLTREEAYFSNQKLGQIKSLPRGAAFESPDVQDEAYADGRVAQETIRRLRSGKQRLSESNQPFFIAAGFARPHLPFSAPKKYWDWHDPSRLPMPPFESLPDGAPTVAGKRGGEISNYSPVPTEREASFSPELKRNLIHGYYASTSYVDAQIGKVIDELDRLELSENTIVVLWGDHGFHLGDLGIWTKHTNYEQANRIPIVMVAPGVTKPGSSTLQPTGSVDVFPTLAELAGLPKPTGPQAIDGVSLVPVLRDPQRRVRDHTFHAYPKQKIGRAIRDERYRLVQWRPYNNLGPAEYELYDYQTDPLETKNLYSDLPDVARRLQSILDRYPEPVDRNKQPKSKPSPKINNRPLNIVGRVASHANQGVAVAQGGRVNGYALHLVDGKLAFDVRVRGDVTRVSTKDPVPRAFNFRATLSPQKMELFIDNQLVAHGKSPGLIPSQPDDGLDIGMDLRTAAGDYTAPNPLDGRVTGVKVNP